MPNSKPLFPLGQIVATPGALALLNEAGVNPADFLASHASGHWGSLCQEDKKLNDEAVENGDRILSSYEVDGETIWVITEWDRSVTTLLRSSEY